MIRKIFMLALVIILFVYMAWNFYAKAVIYDPLAEVTLKKAKTSQSDAAHQVKYQKVWSDAIHEKNLFSPSRTYREPVRFVPPPPPPPPPAVVEPPPKKPDLALRGIVLDTFGEYVAFIEIDKGKAVPMRKGDKNDNVELVDISDRQVVLKWNEEKIPLSIDKVKTIMNPRLTK